MPKNRNGAGQLTFGAPGFKKKSFPPAKVMERALKIDAIRKEKAKQQVTADTLRKELERVSTLFHSVGLTRGASASQIFAKIKELKEKETYHTNAERMNATASDVEEASEHRAIAKKYFEQIADLEKILNSRAKRKL
jgi:hypothetical protein